jgi:hypothetical protein
MSLPLNEALAQVDLEPGRTYRCEVNGKRIELRVLLGSPLDMRPVVIDESDIMLDSWVEFPPPGPGIPIKVVPGELPLPDVPHIPSEDEYE